MYVELEEVEQGVGDRSDSAVDVLFSQSQTRMAHLRSFFYLSLPQNIIPKACLFRCRWRRGCIEVPPEKS